MYRHTKKTSIIFYIIMCTRLKYRLVTNTTWNCLGFKMDYRIGQLLPTTMDKWVATWDDFHQMLLYDDFAHYQSINRLTDTHLYDINDYPSLVLLI